MSDTPTPTDAAQWRQQRQHGELVTLPGCGHVARLVRPSLTALAAATNGVHNPLTQEVLALAAGRPAATEAERLGNYRRNARAYVEAAALCLREPRLILDREPSTGEIGPDDLADYDYVWFYYTWIGGPDADVAPFRVAGEPAPA